MLAVILAAVVFSAARVRAVNRTIDDIEPSWTYEPRASFGAISASHPCPECTSQPDPAQAFGQTWEDCSGDGTATLTFNGTAVAIYVICPAPHVNGTYTANFSFKLDGVDGPPFKPANGCLQNTYNYLVYSTQGLALQVHSISITNHPSDDQFSHSDLLLDYAVVDDGTPYPSHHQAFPVAAVVVPVLIVVLVISAAVLFVRRRRAARAMQLDTEPTPYKAPSLMSYPMDTISSANASNPGGSMLPRGSETAGAYSHSELSPSPSGTTLVAVDRKRSGRALNPVLESQVSPPAYEDTLQHDRTR